MSTSDSLPVLIKANRDGFTLVPDSKASFEAILAFVEQRLNESKDFFRHAHMMLDLRERPLRTDEIQAIHALLADKAEVKMVEVRLGEALSFVVDRAPVRQEAPPKPVPPVPRDDAPLLVRATCRSGTRIESPSDCVVLGDVNPGAEIVALGDIIIFGNLRGIAHAGAGGDRSARIWALSIEPSQIRIADMVALLPRSGKSPAKRFEIAEIQADTIEILTL